MKVDGEVGCLLAALKLNEGKKVCKKCFCYLLTGPVAPVCSLTQLADDCGEQMEQKTCQGCSALCEVSVSVDFNESAIMFKRPDKVLNFEYTLHWSIVKNILLVILTIVPCSSYFPLLPMSQTNRIKGRN